MVSYQLQGVIHQVGTHTGNGPPQVCHARLHSGQKGIYSAFGGAIGIDDLQAGGRQVIPQLSGQLFATQNH